MPLRTTVTFGLQCSPVVDGFLPWVVVVVVLVLVVIVVAPGLPLLGVAERATEAVSPSAKSARRSALSLMKNVPSGSGLSLLRDRERLKLAAAAANPPFGVTQ